MTEKELQEWAEFLGITVDEAIKLRERGIRARELHNRFVMHKGEGRFIKREEKTNESE